MSETTIGTVIGGVRLDAEIGRGGMGVVYRGYQVALNRTVAVKVVRGSLADDEGFRQRFRRECEIAAGLEHPHVVPIYSADSDEQQLSVTMRFVDGPDLGAFLRERGRLAPDAAAEVVGQIAGALDTAHRRGLVHRDVKPANILVGAADGRPHTYLTDFGLSRATADLRGLTGTGVLLGTPGYMAPEQYEDGQVDARVDVYALGCVLFQCLTGRMPFVRDSAPALMWAHFSETPPPLGTVVAGLPDRLDGVVRRAMAKRPEDRYPTAGDMARDVADAVGAGTVGAWTPGGPSRQDTTTVVSPASIPPQRPSTVPPTSVPPTSVPPMSAPTVSSPFARGGQVPPSGPSWTPGPPPPPSWPSTPSSAAPPPRRRSRWLTVGLPVTAVVLVALLVGVVALVSSGSTGEIVGGPIAVGRNPIDVESGAGVIWTANADDGTVSEIDPATGTSRQIAVGGVPNEVVVDGGAVWVNNFTDAVTRLDIATGTARIIYLNQPSPVSGTVAGDGSLWISDANANTVTRINTGLQAADPAPPIPVGRGASRMVYDNHRLYVMNTADRSISVLDQNGRSLGPPIVLSTDVIDAEVDQGTLWVLVGDVNAPADRRNYALVPVDTASWLVGGQIPLGNANWVDVENGVGWAAYPLANEVRRIDLASGQVNGDPITGVGRGTTNGRVVGDQLWTTNASDNTVVRVQLDG